MKKRGFGNYDLAANSILLKTRLSGHSENILRIFCRRNIVMPKVFRKLAAENRIVPIMIKRAGRKLHFIGKLMLIKAAWLAVTSFPQTLTLPPVVAPPLALIAAPPVFEVTTVKLNKSGGSGSGASPRRTSC